MGTLTRKCLTETQVFFPINQILNSFFKMGKFTFTFIFVTAFIAGTFGAPRTQRSTGCNLNGDVSKNLLELRFDQDRDFKCMRRLLQKGADVNAKDNYDYTPIMYAAKGASNKAFNAVRYLVSKGAQLNAKNYYSTNALHFAVFADNGDIVKFLIEKGAEGDLSDLLMLAVRYGKELTESVQALVNKGADVNKVSGPNEYPYVNDSLLIIAAQNDHMEIVKVLLEKGANFNAKCHSRSWCLGKDTLIYAATFGDLEIIQLLFSKGVNVNVQDKVGNSALMMAARNGHESVTHYLLENGANVNLINEEGYSAMIYATEEGHKTIVQQLKAKGAYMIDSYMFSFADLFPSFISDRFQKLRSIQRNNHVNPNQGN